MPWSVDHLPTNHRVSHCRWKQCATNPSAVLCEQLCFPIWVRMWGAWLVPLQLALRCFPKLQNSNGHFCQFPADHLHETFVLNLVTLCWTFGPYRDPSWRLVVPWGRAEKQREWKTGLNDHRWRTYSDPDGQTLSSSGFFVTALHCGLCCCPDGCFTAFAGKLLAVMMCYKETGTTSFLHHFSRNDHSQGWTLPLMPQDVQNSTTA